MKSTFTPSQRLAYHEKRAKDPNLSATERAYSKNFCVGARVAREQFHVNNYVDGTRATAEILEKRDQDVTHHRTYLIKIKKQNSDTPAESGMLQGQITGLNYILSSNESKKK